MANTRFLPRMAVLLALGAGCKAGELRRDCDVVDCTGIDGGSVVGDGSETLPDSTVMMTGDDGGVAIDAGSQRRDGGQEPVDAGLTGLPPAGIYRIWTATRDVDHLDFVRGGQIYLSWHQVEPSRGTFDWSMLRAGIARYGTLNKPFTVQINSETKPSWLWDHIAKCKTIQERPRIGDVVPEYLDPLYLTLQGELITALATELTTTADPDSLLLVRASPNAIGTEHTDPYDILQCTPTASGHKYNVAWSQDLERAYYRNVMGLYYDRLIPRKIRVALRARTFWLPQAPTQWLGVDKAWLLWTGSEVDKGKWPDNSDAFALTWTRTGKTVGFWEPFGSSLDSTTWGVRPEHPVSWNYWRNLLELQKGVSYIATYGEDIEIADNDSHPDRAEYRAAFEFANRYAGYHAAPSTSPGAWCALRKGESTHAREPLGNYGWFLNQIDPDTTSVGVESKAGLEPIGPKEQRFGRFARRTDRAAGRSALSFAVDPPFQAGINGKSCRLRVWYLDEGQGDWTLRYGANGSSVRRVEKNDTGRWSELVEPVMCSVLEGKLQSAPAPDSHLRLEATSSGGDTTFHMVEIEVVGR